MTADYNGWCDVPELEREQEQLSVVAQAAQAARLARLTAYLARRT